VTRIFVSGVAGFLGSHLADALLARGHEVIGCDNYIGGEFENIPKGVVFHIADCNDLDRMREIVKGCEIVYHCAATPYEGLSVFSPHTITQGIVTASTGMFSAAISRGVRRVITLSSMARYGTNDVPFVESMEPRPQDPYGIGKVCVEQMLANLASLHDFEHVICVPHNIIGPRQRHTDPFRNVASIFIHRMLLGKQPIIYGDGAQMRCFSFVDDVVDPLVAMAIADVDGEVINVGPDDGFISINGLAQVIANLIDFKLDPIYEPGRPAEVRLANCSANKARDLLDYHPRIKLEAGLMTMIDWIRPRIGKFEYHLPLEIVNDRTPRAWAQRLM